MGVVVVPIFAIIVWNASHSMLGGDTAFDGWAGAPMGTTGLPESSSSDFANPLSLGSARSEKAASFSAVTVPVNRAEDSQSLPQIGKKIIRNGNLTLKVDNTDDAARKITEIVNNNNGEVSSSNFYRSANNAKNGTIAVKTPVNNFDKTFTEIKEVASLVVRESTSSQDVTEQYIDLQAQLKNRQAEEQSFVKILDQAQKIQDILEITAQLARVRGNIEQLQGKIKYLESQTDMSTISIALSEDANITVVDSWRPWQVVKDSFNSLAKGLQGFANLLIRFFIILLPLLVIWVIIIWVVYRIGKKIYFKIKNKENK